ncbi:MAG TPA: YitT family protein [Erysipelothrix sp.]|nr:YitT family protein [Erysipelothrix sp.]
MKENIKNWSLLFLGNFILVLGVVTFILPNDVLSGGVAGVAVALSPLVNIEPKYLINIILLVTFVFGFIFLGKDFALKTIMSTILYPIYMAILSNFNIAIDVDPLMASLFGGLVTGVGLGITFRTGASTGGMDIPPLILQKLTGVKLAVWMVIIDALTVLLGLRSYGINAVLTGLISVFAATFAVDKMQLIRGDGAKQVMIITMKKLEVLQYIHENLDRGSTLIPATGGFTGESRDMIMTILEREQYVQLETAVKEMDEDAFLIVSDVTEVHGKGFYRV